MRKATSIVLTGLLLILPVEQVLAQAVQQEAVSVQQTTPSDGAAQLFRVPPLTENAARLLGASSDRAVLDAPLVEPPLTNRDAVPGWSDWSNRKRVLIVLAYIAGSAVFLALIVAGLPQ